MNSSLTLQFRYFMLVLSFSLSTMSSEIGQVRILESAFGP